MDARAEELHRQLAAQVQSAFDRGALGPELRMLMVSHSADRSTITLYGPMRGAITPTPRRTKRWARCPHRTGSTRMMP